ncbi:cupin domain-containing protein [Euzebya sp.]|uniref:cupin domain-containing protein n=1 Tax=Euzebya sp. TaxID=1971409 RepID=UPI0035131CE2
MRRVVTVRDATGRSSIQVDDEPEAVVRFGPGFAVYDLWRTEAPPTSPVDGHVPDAYTFEPPTGAVFRIVVIPPDEVVEVSIRRGDRWGQNSPYRETGDAYGLHATATQDYVTVLSGRVDLRMPDGDQVRLEPGDVAVQCGAVHAWRNPGPDPLVLSVVMLGTRHGADDGGDQPSE